MGRIKVTRTGSDKMSLYLNTKQPFENYRRLAETEYFVDKTTMIDKINKRINTTNCYVCITRPRRFGKSSIADMLGAYYSNAVDSKELFDNLNISGFINYNKNLNKYNVIYISFNEIPDEMNDYSDYIGNIKNQLRSDILETFKEVDFLGCTDIYKMLQKTNERFIFILDEWDYIFDKKLFVNHQDDFLEFLRNLLKGKQYVSLAYMTGVLPIKKYSVGSALNMFDEYTMLNDPLYGRYFGFTEDEVENLCNREKKITFDEISEWYNGYLDTDGEKIFNPRSVVKALFNRKCQSYWTNTGAMDEVENYLKYNIHDVRDDVIAMIAGNSIDIFIDEEFRAGQKPPRTKEEIYSAMIVLGFLSYYDGELRIPNKELMREFEKSIQDECFGAVAEIIKRSKDMLRATLSADTDTMSRILHDIHNYEIPVLQYNNENSLSYVVTLAYLYARDFYRIEREEWKRIC